MVQVRPRRATKNSKRTDAAPRNCSSATSRAEEFSPSCRFNTPDRLLLNTSLLAVDPALPSKRVKLEPVATNPSPHLHGRTVEMPGHCSDIAPVNVKLPRKLILAGHEVRPVNGGTLGELSVNAQLLFIPWEHHA